MTNGWDIAMQGLSTWANYQVTTNLNEKNRDFSREMADLSYQRNIEQWNRQNDYNSPKSQLNRYVEAGLNPNLLYGQVNSGNATSSPTYETPKHEDKIPRIDLPSLVGFAQGIANIKKTMAETNLIDDRAYKERLLGDMMNSRAVKSEYDLRSFEYEVKNIAKEMGLATTQTVYTPAEFKVSPGGRRRKLVKGTGEWITSDVPIAELYGQIRARSTQKEFEHLSKRVDLLGYQADILKHQKETQNDFTTGVPSIDSLIKAIGRTFGGDADNLQFDRNNHPIWNGILNFFGL